MENISWIYDLKDKVPLFLEKLKGTTPGFYRYSLSGDIYGEDAKWGLGQAVFAIKTLYTLGLLQTLTISQKLETIDFINSFQSKNTGYYHDPLIWKKSLFRNIASSVKHLNANNMLGRQTIVAETRQTLSALRLLNYSPLVAPTDVPQTPQKIIKYLSRLNWKKPWNAGSHFSHLIYFLHNSTLSNKKDLINTAIGWLDKARSPDSGSFHTGETTSQEKINGAMKVITGLNIVNRLDAVMHPHTLIDLCLSAKNDQHACDNFNIVYVLKYAHERTGNSYRTEEIRQFALDRLSTYRCYYYPEFGGFSFYPERANQIYYAARITKGLAEPDIHGTCMFLWGIAIIAQILSINDKLGFNEFLP